MKVSKSDNEKIETIVCPVCGVTTEVTKVTHITIDDTPIKLHDAVGKIYLCMNPECGEYLKKINDEFKLIEMSELIKTQAEITDLLAKEAEVTKARLFPRVAELEAGRILSSALYTLTAGSVFRRPYSVEEILEACAAVGLHPEAVNNSTIPLVVGWLEEHKGI